MKPAPAPRAKTALGYPGTRRRLSPLETAAAVAVILSCLIATAMMTGMLPAAMQKAATGAPIATRTGSEIQPVPTALAALPAPEVNPADRAAGAGVAAVTHDSSLPADRAGSIAVSTTGLAAGLLAATPAAPAANPPTPTLASRPARHRRPAVAHQRERSGDLPSRTKTREEVVGELLRAKRDGSYSSAMEAYR